jgi:ribosomal protein S18 acetylase RimI-like enzyme
MAITFRQAQVGDFDYCANLYFAWMDRTIEELKIDRPAHVCSFHERWHVHEVRIITRDGLGIGWLQSRVEDEALFLAQLFLDRQYQGQGIGTEVMHRLIDEAKREGRAVTLGVVKTNPALRLYQRLGFCTTHEDERKVYMRREPSANDLYEAIRRRISPLGGVDLEIPRRPPLREPPDFKE